MELRARMTMTPNRSDEVVLTKVENESILFDSTGGTVHVLNSTGAAIWELLDGKKTLEEITKKIAEEFEADPAEVRPDVDAFIVELKGKGLLTE